MNLNRLFPNIMAGTVMFALTLALAAPAQAWFPEEKPDKVVYDFNVNGGKGGKGGDVDLTNQVYAEGGAGGRGGAGGSARQRQGQRQQASANNGGVNIRQEAPDLSQMVPNLGGVHGSSYKCDVVASEFVVPGFGFAFGVPSNKECKNNRDTAQAIENAKAFEELGPVGRTFAAANNHQAWKANEALREQAKRQAMTAELFASLNQDAKQAFCKGKTITVNGQPYALSNGGSCHRQ